MNFLQVETKTIKYILKSCFKEKLNFLNFLILILLISSSVYSAYSAFLSYLLDNTAANIAVKTVNNPLPLTKYITIEMAARNNTLFPETWHIGGSERQQLFSKTNFDRLIWPTIAMLEESNLAFLKNFSSSDHFSLQRMVGVALAAGTIARMDGDFLPAFTRDDVFTENYRSVDLDEISRFFQNISQGLPGVSGNDHFHFIEDGAYTPKLMSMLDDFMANQHCSDLVDKTISHIVTPDFVRLFGSGIRNSTNIPVELTHDFFNWQSIIITVPLEFSRDAPTERTVLGVFPFDNSSTRFLFVGVSHQFAPFDTILTSTGHVPLNDVAFKHPIVLVKTDLRNYGVYESSAVRSEAECRMCENLTDIEHCKFKCLLDTVVDQCRCMPFSYRKLYNTDSVRNKLHYCKTTDYGQCLKSAKYDQSRCSSEKVVPCVAHDDDVQPWLFGFESVDDVEKNNLVSDIYPFIKDGPKYRLYFVIDFDQSMYVHYKEVPQNSCMEMLGQVGGNLGLFLSFSLYGLWRVLVFSFANYKKYHDDVSDAGSNDGRRGSIQTWLNLAQLSAETDAAKRIRKRIREQIDALLQQLGDEEERVAGVRKKFLEFQQQSAV